MLDESLNETLLKERLGEMLGQNYRCIGIYDNEKLIGICGIWILTKYYVGKYIEPDNVVILPEYQGQNIGKQLMQWIYDYAQKINCVASELNCYVGNKKAQSFWEKEGYEVIGLHYQKKFNSFHNSSCGMSIGINLTKKPL